MNGNGNGCGRKRVLVLMGGWSAEREVSLSSGTEVARALNESGYRVDTLDVTRDVGRLMAALSPKPDVVFNALHGKGGEDGTIQGLLDMLEIPYTHSGVLASALAMDKPAAKQAFVAAGLRCPEGIVVPREVLVRGGAQVSEQHCNFLINTGGATAAEIEALGNEVARRVHDATGVSLEWEIRRVGDSA